MYLPVNEISFLKINVSEVQVLIKEGLASTMNYGEDTVPLLMVKSTANTRILAYSSFYFLKTKHYILFHKGDQR